MQFWHLQARRDESLSEECTSMMLSLHFLLYQRYARFLGGNPSPVFKHPPLWACVLTWILCELRSFNSTLNSCKIPTGKFHSSSSTGLRGVWIWSSPTALLAQNGHCQRQGCRKNQCNWERGCIEKSRSPELALPVFSSIVNTEWTIIRRAIQRITWNYAHILVGSVWNPGGTVGTVQVTITVNANLHRRSRLCKIYWSRTAKIVARRI